MPAIRVLSDFQGYLGIMSSRPAIHSLLLALLCGMIAVPEQGFADPIPLRVDSTAKPGASGHTASSAPQIPGRVSAPDFLVGVIASHQDDYVTAARSFSAALAADPNNAALLRQTFTQAALAGAPEAVELARQSVKQPGGRTILSAFVLGNDAVRHGQWQDAATIYATMPTDALTRLLVPLLRAWCLAGAQKAPEAIQLLLLPSYEKSPIFPFYLTHAGLIASLGNDTAQANRLYEQAMTRMPGRDLLLTRARANALWQSGRQAEARDLVRQIARTDTALSLAEPELQATLTNPPLTTAQEGIAYSYVLLAFLLHQQAAHAPEAESTQQIDVASTMMLRMALALQPGLASARLMLAETEESLGHKDVALAVLKDIPPSDPLIRVARYRIALLSDALGDRTTSAQILEKLVQEQPDQPLLSRALGALLFEEKDWQGSIAAFTTAINAATSRHTLDWTLLFERAASYERAGQWPKSEADLQAARQMVPDEPLVLNFLAYGWVQRGEHLPEALSLLERALSLDPDDAAIRDSLGWALIRSGNVHKGTELLEKAAEQTPLDAEVNYHLGVAYWNLGRHSEAIDQWNVAQGLKPEPDDLARIRKALDFAKNASAGTPVPIEDVPVPN